MPSLRRRMPAMEASAGRDVKTSYRALPTSKAEPGFSRKRILDRGRIRAILSSLTIAFIFVVFNKFIPRSNPESYALCSPEGKIYTVDPLRNVTDCILVHGKFILETGSLGLCLPATRSRSAAYIFHTDEVKQRWKSENTGRSNSRSNAVPFSVGRLAIRYTKKGSIVVPGLSDSHGHILEHGKNLQLNLDGLSSPQRKHPRIYIPLSSCAHTSSICRGRKTNWRLH